MRFEEIDEALRRQPAWEPPRDFARRIARTARPLHLDAPFHPRDVFAFGLQALRDALLNVAATISGVRWTVRQYWLLLSH
jgi:hypothetical protein